MVFRAAILTLAGLLIAVPNQQAFARPGLSKHSAQPEILIAQTTPKKTPEQSANYAQYYQTYQSAPSSVQSVLRPPILFGTQLVKPLTSQSVESGIANDLVVMVAEVQILGAGSDLLQTVRTTIQTQPGGETSQGQLQQDVEALLRTGLFTAVQVRSQGSTTGLRVTYQVEPIVVASFQLVGAQVLTPAVVNQIFDTQLGGAVNPTVLDQGVKKINEWYARNGYSLARVLTLQPSQEGVVTLEVAEGVIEDINIRFIDSTGKTENQQGQPIQGKTQVGFLQQQLQLQPGQVFREDLARKDIQQLYQLGLFEQVNLKLGGDAQRVKLNYALNERSPRNINLGGGYNADRGIFGVVSFRDQNVNGLAQPLDTDLQIGTRDLQFNSNFSRPYRASQPDQLGYRINVFRRRGLSDVFDDSLTLANGDQVREGRFGGGITLTRPIADWMGAVGLSYTRISLRDRDGNISPTDRQGNPLSLSGTGIDDLTTLSLGISRDQRDNPINPSQGSILKFSTEQSLPLGLGGIVQNRLQGNYIEYRPVRWLASPVGEFPEVLAFNLQGGTTLGDLPPYNAFNLGGPNSVRGYVLGGVGSGRSYVLASTEYRFPLLTSPLAGVFFADFASDLGSGSSVLGAPAVARGKPGTGFGYGAGLRVQSPIGIIRADLGFTNQGESRLQIGLGQRF